VWFIYQGTRFLVRLFVHTLILFNNAAIPSEDGFGGLVVSMLASGSQVRGFDPDRSRWIFSDVKISGK
jgi:hypothetical protein